MPDTMHVTLITAVDCHLCEELKNALKRLARERPIDVEEVAWSDDAGRQLVNHDGVPFPPALYVNGVFRGYGRFSERRLRHVLSQL
ncbi:MAG: glutaredoxin family protein [bacterium]|nr:glutaredoxin family protein [bacterium]